VSVDRVVCLDLGGVVVRICRSWEEGCDRAGVQVRGAERFDDLQYRERRHDLTDAYMAGRIACEEFFRTIADTTGGLYTPDEVRRVHDAWVIDEYAGVRELIDELNATPGVRTACLSNTNHAHWEPLIADADRWPSIARLGTRLVSHELGAVKPDPRIYELAERALAAPPDRIHFFDDLEPNVAAAAARGWRATPIDHDADTAAQLRDALAAAGVL